MKRFSQILVSIRLESGYKTSKSYYNYLKSRGLDCNYQYYVKIESAQVIASSIIINQIAKAVDKEQGELLIKAFCSDQFESFNYLFQDTKLEKQKVETVNFSSSVAQGQKELTLAQIDCLHKKKGHYFLFLILTLARKPLSITELKKYPLLEKSISALVTASIAHLNEGILNTSSSEFVFPKTSHDKKLEGIYSTFDNWDQEFSAQFEFKKFLNKMMIRRISPRYFTVMQKQIEAFTDFVRCSDESDQRYNSEVIHLHISMSKGSLPG